MPQYEYIDKTGKMRTIEASDPNTAIANAPDREASSGVALVKSATAPEKAPGDISGGLSGGANEPQQGASTLGEMGNLRIALRSALSEAAQNTATNRLTQMSGLMEGGLAPGGISAAIGLARSGLQTSQETVMSDVMAAYKDASDAKKKELDRINELRLEFGSAVPNNVTDLKTALDLVAPLVDKERRLKLAKLSETQTEDNDVESAAEFVAKGGSLAQIGGSSAYKARVRIRAEQLKITLEADAKKEYENRIAFRLEKKTSDFATERSLAMQDDNLTVAEQRDLLDYIDGLEQSQKASKASGSKGFFSFLNPEPQQQQAPQPSQLQNIKPQINIPSFGGSGSFFNK